MLQNIFHFQKKKIPDPNFEKIRDENLFVEVKLRIFERVDLILVYV